MLKIKDLQAALADKLKLQTDLDAANQKVKDLEAQLGQANDTARMEKERADTLQVQIDEANSTIDQLNGKVTTLEGNQKNVSQQTIEKLHELGVPATELPSSTKTGQDDEEILATYQNLKGGERTAFLRKNRAALERAAAAKK
jgi:predicted  nucleic acid-binding Zn-ribbon protein